MTLLIINPNSTASMTDSMLDAARRAAPALEIEGWTSVLGPPAIQGAADGEAAAAPLLHLMDKAAEQGAGGVIIGCFDDTALEDATRRTGAPVIGIGQAAFHYCALRSWRFSVVTTLAVSVPVIEANLRRYGLFQWVGRVRASEIPVLALEDDEDAALRIILAEARCALDEDGIDALVLGCAGMVTLADRLQDKLGVPVIDPVRCAATSMVWLAQ